MHVWVCVGVGCCEPPDAIGAFCWCSLRVGVSERVPCPGRGHNHGRVEAWVRAHGAGSGL